MVQFSASGWVRMVSREREVCADMKQLRSQVGMTAVWWSRPAPAIDMSDWFRHSWPAAASTLPLTVFIKAHGVYGKGCRSLFRAAVGGCFRWSQHHYMGPAPVFSGS